VIIRKKKIEKDSERNIGNSGNSGKNDAHSMIISFSINSGICKSPSEKTKFFKKLYGWNQKVPGKKKEYEYRREGVLDEVPHMRISQSSFIIPEEDFEKISQFFEEWQKKVIFNAFKVLIEDESIFDEFDKFRKDLIDESEDQIGPDVPEPGVPGDEEEPEEPNEEEMSDEEQAIARRYTQWQKAKKK